MRYKIKKSSHYNQKKWFQLLSLLLGAPLHGLYLNFGRSRVKYCRLRSEDWYPRSSVKHTGWNKLFGFSGWNIHKYSARIVWQPDFSCEGRFRLALYVYGKGDGKWKSSFLTIVEGDVDFLAKITAKKTYYQAIIDSSITTTLPANKTPHWFNAEPFFGGQSPAPKDIVIYLWDVWFYKLIQKLKR